MCGIAGFIDHTLSSEQASQTIGRMLSSISHRGPDASDNYIQLPVVLGHNRLSILDLSPDGTQPMHHFNSRITFNGEIYNYVEVREELKKKGYQFKTGTDTEVIQAAYREYGEKCVDHFIGMWSFALWDEKEQILFCSRDRFGIKPFYYIFDSGNFYFGSEYRVLKSSPVFKNNLNLNQVSRGLQLGWVCYDDETYYDALKALPAGCNLIYKNLSIAVKRYWDLNENTSLNSLSLTDTKDKLLELLLDSVSIHMRSDVEIAICLSGGIDSSSLTALISKCFPSTNYKSYSIYYDGKNEVDERPFISEVINKYPKIIPNYIKPSEEDILERFHEIMESVDVPSTGSSNFSHYYLLEKIHADGIKVVVDGQGADEYLAGYMHSMFRVEADYLRAGKIIPFVSNLFSDSRETKMGGRNLISDLGKSMLSTLFNEQQLYSFEYKNYYPFVSKNRSYIPFKLKETNGNRLNTFLYNMVFTTSLPTILHYVDRMTMAHSVESRVPFLDHRLVEFGYSVNSSLKVNKGITKYILRETLKDYLPDKIYNRKDKKGFVTPGEEKWLRGKMNSLLDIDYKRIDFLNTHVIRKLVDEYKKGDNKNAKLIWRIATLNYWLKNFN